MSEELLQRGLIDDPEKIGKWNFYNIGATSLKALKDHGIIPRKDYKLFEKRKPDAIITDRKKVIAVIENKRPSDFNTKEKKAKALKQGLEVSRVLESKILILTDTTETLWISVASGKEIKDETGKLLKSVFKPKEEDTFKLLEQIDDNLDSKTSQLTAPKLKDPTKLAKSVWQDLWSVSGATPENCLYTFVELFIFKYLSDLGVLRNHLSYDTLMSMFEKQHEDEVLEYYAENIRNHIKKKLFPPSKAANSDNTTIINGTIFVSKDETAVQGYGAVFKKILSKFGDEKQGGGELKNIDHDFKSKLFETFLKESISKKNWGQFFTPLKVVRAIVEMARSEVREGITICDPACGVGKFLLEPILNDINRFYKIENGKLKRKITLLGIDKGFDREEQKTIILAKANMLIYMSDLIRKHTDITDQFSTLFNDSFILKTKNILGSLRDPMKDKIDLILTNPPYVTSGSSNLKDEIVRSGLQSHFKVGGLGVEGLFMEWIVRALKPGGKAFIVVPDGIFNRSTDKNLRKFLIDECYFDSIISLPLNTFFTTNKKTFILAITKKEDRAAKQKDPIFTYLVSEIGESLDVNRFETTTNHLNEAVELYNQYKGSNKSKYKTKDERCKIFPFDKLESTIETGWIIDRWWSEEEKVKLGISDTKGKLTVTEFSAFVGEVATTLLDFQEQLKDIAEKKKPLNFKMVKLSQLFQIEKGQARYTKAYGSKNPGTFPVYSASNHKPLTSIDTFDYDGCYLTWATNGFAGYIKIIEGKFSINGDRGILIPLNPDVDIFYVKSVLEPQLRSIAKGRVGENGSDEFTKVYPSMIENLEVPIPTKINGEYDLAAQKEVANNDKTISELISKLDQYRRTLEIATIQVNDDMKNSAEFEVSKVFDLAIKTNSSKFTKEFVNAHKGTIPVYSASKDLQSVDYGFVKDNLPGIKYFNDCLTWNIDGSIGKAHYRNGRFSLSEKVIPLILKDKNSFNIDYLKYAVELEFAKHAFGFGNKAGKGKISKIKIKVPVDKNGFPDLDSQKDIASQFNMLEKIKNDVLTKLAEASSVKVNPL